MAAIQLKKMCSSSNLTMVVLNIVLLKLHGCYTVNNNSLQPNVDYVLNLPNFC